MEICAVESFRNIGVEGVGENGVNVRHVNGLHDTRR